jgi:hypothetical protein
MTKTTRFGVFYEKNSFKCCETLGKVVYSVVGKNAGKIAQNGVKIGCSPTLEIYNFTSLIKSDMEIQF